MRRRLELLGWLAALWLVVAGGHALGSGVLSVPIAEVAAWRNWATETEPLIMTMALLRLLLVTLVWYLLATTLLGVAARMLRAVRLLRFADAVSAPVVRRIVARGTGAFVATAIATAGLPGQAMATPPSTAASIEVVESSLTMRGAPADEVAAGALAGSVGSQPSGGRLRLPWELFDEDAGEQGSRGGQAALVGETEPSDRGVSTAPASTVPADDASEHLTSSDPGAAGSPYTVRQGDSLWSIAARYLESVSGAAPTDAEVAPYWRTVIDHNRDRLVVPDDPDLILPGQVLSLPTVQP